MFIHLGGEKLIRTSELIAIFDLSIEKSSQISYRFVHETMKKRGIEKIGEEESKSLVVTSTKLYYSPISPATLKKRAQYLNEQ